MTEAMWKGVPVIVSDASGLAFQVDDGRTGLVAPYTTGEGASRDFWVKALSRLMSDARLRACLVINGLRHAADHGLASFSVTHIHEYLLQVGKPKNNIKQKI